MDISLWWWVGVLGVILVMLAIDLFAHRDAHVIGVKEAAAWSAVWVALGIGFGIIIWRVFGGEYAAQYFSGYTIEKSLAVDNVFVWAIIFSYFAVPREYQHRVLFYGVLGALVMRGAFIAAGAVAIKNFEWILYIFGAFLIFTGIQMLRHRNSHFDVENSKILAKVRQWVPHTDEFHGQKFWIRQAGRWVATPLLFVLVMVEFTDLIFAVDSIPAIFAVTQEPFLVFTANAFAILGLRAMYFLLADLIDRFVYLKVGLSFVLLWVGTKMMLLMVGVKVPTMLSLGIVIAILVAAGVASVIAGRRAPQADAQVASVSDDVEATEVRDPHN